MSNDEFIRTSRSTSRIAIIGRPNVGKSTLFNYLTESRRSVVKNQPGVTRDILLEPAELWGHKYDVIDTGGLTEAKDHFSRLIRVQVVEFLKSVDRLIVVMDGRTGLHPEDRDIIRIASETGKPYLLVVNKIDSVQKDAKLATAEFYEFGVDVVAASFEARYGMDLVLEWIAAQIDCTENTVREGLNIALVGKPNVGKSSLCNRLLGENRLLVSDIAGTTTDSVDSELLYDGRKYILVDTAGLRRSAKREEDLEIISAFKTRDAIRRADVTILIVDGTIGPTSQDAKILEEILKQHRAVILVANKSDLGEKTIPSYRTWFRDRVSRELHFFSDIPVVFTSALSGSGLKDLFRMIGEVEDKINLRIKTRELNDFFMNVIRQAPAPVWGVQNVKFYYLTQTQQRPPAFIAFANHPDGVDNSYRRFLTKRIQEQWDLKGIPVRIFVMSGSHAKRRRKTSTPINVVETEYDLTNEPTTADLESAEMNAGDFDTSDFEMADGALVFDAGGTDADGADSSPQP